MSSKKETKNVSLALTSTSPAALTKNSTGEFPLVFSWTDSETEAVGWVVMDRTINGVSGGGIFMTPTATEQEVADIARNMSKKFTVCDPQIGGAKAGIRFNPRDPRAEQVLSDFIKAMGLLLRNVWVTAGDLGTSDAFIEKVIQTDLGLPTCQSWLGRRIADETGSRDRSCDLAKLIEFPATAHFPMIEGSVGYGLAMSVRYALDLTAVKRTTSSSTSSSTLPRVLIQGFGAVGTSLALFLEENKIATVVGIADKDGFVHHSTGLPIVELLNVRRERRRRLVEEQPAAADVVAECDKNLLCNLSAEDKVKWNATERKGLSDEDFFIAFLKSEQAEVVCPCAQRYQLTQRVVDVLLSSTWRGFDGVGRKFIVSGANNPYGVLLSDGKTAVDDKGGAILRRLCLEGVCVIPDWVANSGTAQLFHRGLSLDFDLREPQPVVAHKILEACARPIVAFLREAQKRVASTDLDMVAPRLAQACEDLAAHRLKFPVPLMNKTSPSAGSSAASTVPPMQAVHRSRYALPPCPKAALLTVEEKYQRIFSVAAKDECIMPDELRALLARCPNPVAYDGFEPSGRMHLAQGLMKKNIVNKMTSAGCTFILYVADWFAQMNQKLGGDLEKIKTVGRYFIEIWKAVGMNMERVQFVWASDLILGHSAEYWRHVLGIATKMPLQRTLKCIEIMGRDDETKLQTSQILYPVMQCADIFAMGVDICQLGVDQRKVNMYARDYLSADEQKPIILSHVMLPGLKEGKSKMSKSDPMNAMFMEDTEEEIKAKIAGAFCPPLVVDNNPCFLYMQEVVLPSFAPDGVAIGKRVVTTADELRALYTSGAVHPKDLKAALTDALNRLLQPVRLHFEQNAEARALLEQVKTYRATAIAATATESKAVEKKQSVGDAATVAPIVATASSSSSSSSAQIKSNKDRSKSKKQQGKGANAVPAVAASSSSSSST